MFAYHVVSNVLGAYFTKPACNMDYGGKFTNDNNNCTNFCMSIYEEESVAFSILHVQERDSNSIFDYLLI